MQRTAFTRTENHTFIFLDIAFLSVIRTKLAAATTAAAAQGQHQRKKQREEESEQSQIAISLQSIMCNILDSIRAIVFQKSEEEDIVDRDARMIRFGTHFLRLTGGRKTPKLIPQHQVHAVDRRYAFVLEESDNIDGSLVGGAKGFIDFSPTYRIRATRRGKERFLCVSNLRTITFGRSREKRSRWILKYVAGDKTTIHPVDFPHLCLANHDGKLRLLETDSVEDRSHHAWFPHYRES